MYIVNNNKPIKRIFALADLHIRSGNDTSSRYDEYYKVFNNTIKDIKRLYIPEESIIVVLGDIFHCKNKLNSPSIDLFNFLFHNLTQFIPVFMIQGNHDFNQVNKNDEHNDLIKSLNYNYDNLYYLDKTDNYIVNNINFGLIDIKDILHLGSTSGYNEELVSLPLPNKDSEYNIALAHTTVINAKLQNNMMATNGVPMEYFKNYRLTLLGDIHKQQIFKNGETTFVYPGSLIQQDFGETMFDHGFVEIKLDENKISKQHVYNEYGKANISVKEGEYYINSHTPIIKLKKFLKLPNIPKYIHIHAYCDNTEELRKKFNNIKVNINFINIESENNNINEIEKFNSSLSFIEYIDKNSKLNDDQWKIYINDFNKFIIDEELPESLKKIVNERNKQFIKFISDNPIESKNYNLNNFMIHELKWNWILPYGKNNKYTFNNNNTVDLVYAPNGNGKSAIFDIICLGLFNSPVPSRINKSTTASLINSLKPKEQASNISIIFSVNEKKYKINRKFTYSRNKFEAQTSEAVLLNEYDEELLYGTKSIEIWVNENICTMNDFLLSTMITQNRDHEFFKYDCKNQFELLDKCLHIDYINTLTLTLKETIKNLKFIIKNTETYVSTIPETMDNEKYKENIIKLEELETKYNDKLEKFNLINIPIKLIKKEVFEPVEKCDELLKRKNVLENELCNKYNLKYFKYPNINLTFNKKYDNTDLYIDIGINLKKYENMKEELINVRKLNKEILLNKPIKPEITLEEYNEKVLEINNFKKYYDEKYGKYVSNDKLNLEELIREKHSNEIQIDQIKKIFPDIVLMEFNIPNEINIETSDYNNSDRYIDVYEYLEKLKQLKIDSQKDKKTYEEMMMEKIVIPKNTIEEYNNFIKNKKEFMKFYESKYDVNLLNKEYDENIIIKNRYEIDNIENKYGKIEPKKYDLPENIINGDILNEIDVEEDINELLEEYENRRVYIGRDKLDKLKFLFCEKYVNLNGEEIKKKINKLKLTLSKYLKYSDDPDIEHIISISKKIITLQNIDYIKVINELENNNNEDIEYLKNKIFTIYTYQYNSNKLYNLYEELNQNIYNKYIAEDKEWSKIKIDIEEYNKYETKKRTLEERINRIDNDMICMRKNIYHAHQFQKFCNLYFRLDINMSNVDKDLDSLKYKKNKEEEKELLNKIEEIELYDKFEEKYNNSCEKINELEKNINELNDVIYYAYKYQKQSNKSNDIILELRDIEVKLEYYYKRKYDLNCELLGIRDELQNKEYEVRKYEEDILRYGGYSKKYLENYLNDLQKRLDIHLKIYDLSVNYKSWLYDNKFLPLITLKTNEIVNMMFPNRNITLNYTYKKNILIWYVKDENNEVYIEKLSGAQSFGINLAFRLAVNRIGFGKMNSSQLFIDEGFCSFDKNNIENVPSLLLNLKKIFKKIILVSHIDSIQYCADNIINIVRDNGISNINI